MSTTTGSGNKSDKTPCKVPKELLTGRPKKKTLPSGSDSKKTAYLRDKAAVLADKLMDDLERVRREMKGSPPSRKEGEDIKDYLARVQVWSKNKPDSADLDRLARAASTMFDKVAASNEDTGLTIKFPKQLHEVLKVNIAIQTVPRLAGAVHGLVTDAVTVDAEEVTELPSNQALRLPDSVVSVTPEPGKEGG